MSRPCSAYTQAIRDLVSKDKKITHKDARPLLKAAGHPIVAEPPTKSAEFAAIEKGYDIGSLVKPDMDKVEGACRQGMKYDDKTTKAVMHEATLRGAWANEANEFNTTKSKWLITLASGEKSPSRKPASSRNNKAKAAKKQPKQKNVPVRRGRQPKVVVPTVESDDSLSVIEKLGGVQAAEAKVASLKAEVATLEAAVAAVKALTARLQKAA